MLMLLFQIANERYALECRRVVEVIPMVSLRKIYRVPDYVAGILNYRGKLVPAIDLCQLIQGQKSRYALSTRIMIIHYHLRNHHDRMHLETSSHLLGIIAEQVTEILQYHAVDSVKESPPDLQTLSDTISSVAPSPNSDSLGKVFFHQQEMIQKIEVNQLMPAPEETALFSVLSHLQSE